MTRSPLVVRDATPADIDELISIWGDVLRRGEDRERAADLAVVIERAAASGRERLVVAELDGRLAGAVHLRIDTLTPLNLEPVVQVISPHVLPGFRRHGVGCALVGAAVAFAEEHGVAHVATGVAAGARDANRFMARLGFGPRALLRVAPTAVVKARLGAMRPAWARAGGRQLTSVLAARRSQRRTELTSR